MEKNFIVLGDCLQNLKNIPDDTFDIAFTSPPYGDGGAESFEDSKELGKTGIHRKYDCVESHIGIDWYDWQVQVIDELLRTCKKYVIYNVGAILQNRENVYKLIGHYADKIHDDIIWYKPNGLPSSTEGALCNTYEHVLIVKKNSKVKVKVKSHAFRNVISTIGTNCNNKYSAIHHAVMNEKLADLIIYEFTEKGDFILDPFMGMGTTAVSCIRYDRNYYGFELSELYYNECLKRLESEKKIERKVFILSYEFPD